MSNKLEVKKNRKLRTCSKGYKCGNSCINKSLNCKKKFNDQASTYAGWLKKQAARLAKKDQKKTPDLKGVGDRALTDAERSQPEKLIEVGKAFAAKFDLENAQAKFQAYQEEKNKYYAVEGKRVAQVWLKRQKVLRQINKLDYQLTIADGKDVPKLQAELKDLEGQLKPLNEEVAKKRFDRLDEIIYELAALPSDRFLSRTTKSQPEFKQKLKDAERRKTELRAEQELEQSKLPGSRDFRAALDGLVKQSGVTTEDAQTLVEQNMRFGTQAGRSGSNRYSTLGSKAEIAQIKTDLVDVTSLTGERNGKVNVGKKYKQSRAHANPSFKFEAGSIVYDFANINVGNSYSKPSSLSSKEVMYHEFSHTLEFQHQEIAEANQKWIKNRATGDVRSLSSLLPNSRYAADERAYPDDFIDPYVGKKYDDRGYLATEVLSMGVQHLSKPSLMQQLFNKDPEHFYLTLGSIIEIQNKNRK
jgi:hypothetical protein